MFVYTVEDVAGLIFILALLAVLALYGFIRLIIWMAGGMIGMMHRLWGYDPDAKEENNERSDN